MDAVMEKYAIEKFDTRNLSMDNAVREQLPNALYYRGDIALLQSSVVAVIGSRNISERGKVITRNISRVLCKGTRRFSMD
ncbi:MAG: DNA-protecting protein DprA [Lachnospiraceae bacterium]|nr:DNA-protecting protein DprA [Lachnospiraceae bacterium]